MSITPRLNRIQIAGNALEKEYDLAYWCWGEPTKKVIICVHGLTRNGRDFDFLAQALADSETAVICPDLPGRGKSDWLGDTDHYNYNTYTNALLKLIDKLDCDQVSWIGTSLGGILGMRIAAEKPHLLHKLVLNDVGAVVPVAGLKRINKYVGMVMNFAGRSAAEDYLKEIYANFGITEDKHWQHLLDHSFSKLSNGEYQLAYDPGILDPLRDQAKRLQIEEDSSLWEWWDTIQCKSLIVRGETSDILLPETADAMLTRNPKAVLKTIPEVGHAPTLMREEQIDMVKDWLLTG